jgi:ATP-binding cassette, subfamily B, bacterial PglK
MRTIRDALALLPPATRRQWAALVPLSLAAAGAEALGAAALYLLIRIVGDPAAARTMPVIARFTEGDWRGTVVVFTVLLAFFYLTKNAFQIWQAWVQTKRVADGRAEIARRALAVYLAAPYPFHLRRNSAELIHNVTTAADDVCRRVLAPAVTVATETLVVLAIVGVLAFTSPAMTLALVLALGTSGAILLRVTRERARRWGERTYALERDMLQGVQATLGAAKEIKVLGREGFFYQQFASRLQALARVRHLSDTLAAVPRVLVESVFVVGALAVVVALVRLGRPGPDVVPLLGLYAYAGFRVIPSANRILMLVNEVRTGGAAVRALRADLDGASPGLASDAASAPLPFTDAIVLEHVSFTYEDAERPALTDLDLTIRRGDAVGVVGPTGAGKSTLVDVLCGLLVPTAGRVLIDGRDLREVPRAWGRAIGYVPQAVALIDDSLRRNIALGVADDAVDDDRVHEVVRMAQLQEFVASLPQGLATSVGEHGVRLSGGQRQRVGIARALYHRPHVLVFDEATAALDNHTEAELLRAVEPLRGALTLIIVAHRLTSVRCCDRLVLLADGGVAGEGRYEDLLNDNPAFRRLAAAEP